MGHVLCESVYLDSIPFVAVFCVSLVSSSSVVFQVYCEWKTDCCCRCHRRQCLVEGYLYEGTFLVTYSSAGEFWFGGERYFHLQGCEVGENGRIGSYRAFARRSQRV